MTRKWRVGEPSQTRVMAQGGPAQNAQEEGTGTPGPIDDEGVTDWGTHSAQPSGMLALYLGGGAGIETLGPAGGGSGSHAGHELHREKDDGNLECLRGIDPERVSVADQVSRHSRCISMSRGEMMSSKCWAGSGPQSLWWASSSRQ
jgi:hypothetical protein